MSNVHLDIMNNLRRDLHASDTIISASHPDAQAPPPTAEIDRAPAEVPLIKRVIGRFTLDISRAETEES